jgi:ATP-binding cassette subfamily F protein 3
MALQSFEGAVVLVSHDRHLLETTVDEFQLVAEGGVRPFDGDLDDYARWLQQSRREAKAPAGDNKTAGKDDAKQRRQDAARLREQLRPLKKEVDKLEKQLDRLGTELSEVETALGDETLYTDPARKGELSELLSRQGDLKSRHEESEMALLEAMQALEDAETE